MKTIRLFPVICRVLVTLTVTITTVTSYGQYGQLEMRDLLNDIKSTRAKIQNLKGSPIEIASQLTALYKKIFGLSIQLFDENQILPASGQLISELFETRLELKNKLARLQYSGQLSPEVLSASRDLFRAARYAEDMIGELANGNVTLGKGEKAIPAFRGGFPLVIKNKAYGTQEFDYSQFRSGDVLLVRGMRNNSAAIARIGDIDSQFSHLAQIYINPTNGQRYLIESLIEDGLIIQDLDEALTHEGGRVALYRYRGPGGAELAHKAAEVVYQRALLAKLPGHEVIYDFSMLPDTYDKLFCSKVIRFGFDIASNGEIKVPEILSTMKMKNRDFFHRIGVNAEITFAPGDIETESRFDLVAEWRDFRATRDMRHKDMVLTKIFQWMERDGMVFDEDVKIHAMAAAAKGGSQVPFIANIMSKVGAKIPDYMTKDIIATMLMLEFTANPLVETIAALDDNHLLAYGVPMHPKDLLDALEDIRAGRNSVGYLTIPGTRDDQKDSNLLPLPRNMDPAQTP